MKILSCGHCIVTSDITYTPTPPLYVVDYRFLKPPTAINIVPSTLQNVQLQIKLLPRMQEKVQFCEIFHGWATAFKSEWVGLYGYYHYNFDFPAWNKLYR